MLLDWILGKKKKEEATVIRDDAALEPKPIEINSKLDKANARNAARLGRLLEFYKNSRGSETEPIKQEIDVLSAKLKAAGHPIPDTAEEAAVLSRALGG